MIHGAALCLFPALLAASPPPRFASEARQVRLDVVATRDGQPLVGLAAADFEVLDNGVRQNVQVASREEHAVHAVLVLDLSSSVGPTEREALQAAAAAFLNQLGPEDHATLLTFTHDLRLISGPGSAETVLASLDEWHGSGSTSLYDAVYAGLTLAGAAAGRPVVIALTDGEDEISWLQADPLFEAARSLEATLHVVGTAEAAQLPATTGFRRQVPATAAFRRAGPSSRQALAAIVKETGGRSWVVGQADSLATAFSRVLAEIKSRYVLVYDVQGEPKPGLHKIQVRLKNRKGEVRTRLGYVAP